MGNWRDSLPSNWLKAADFEKPRLLTIKAFRVEKVGDEQKPVVFFAEDERGLVLNITNGNSIEDIAGSADPATWTGKRIVLYKTETEMKGKRTDCIRVRAPKPGAVPPPPPPDYVATDEDVPF